MNINNISSISTTYTVGEAQTDPNHGKLDVKSVKQGTDVLPTVSRKTSFLSKIKSSPNGYKEKVQNLLKRKLAKNGNKEVGYHP